MAIYKRGDASKTTDAAETKMPSPITILLPGSAWHQADKMYGPLALYLEVLGYDVDIFQLPSAGGDADGVADREAIRKHIDAALHQGTDAVLHAHSYTAMPASFALSDADTAGLTQRDGGRVLGLVLCSGVIPKPGFSLTDVACGKGSRDGWPFPWQSIQGDSLHVSPEHAVEAFYHDLPLSVASAYGTQLVPQSVSSKTVPIGEKTGHDLPCFDGRRAYIRTTQDRAIPPALQDLLLGQPDVWMSREMDTSHSPFLSQPAQYAAVLHEIVTNRMQMLPQTSTIYLHDNMSIRARVKQSCQTCRRRKVKCDGRLPCAPCVVRNDHGQCEYESSERARTSSSPQEPPETPGIKDADETIWIMLKAHLPAKADCEVLLEYYIQECQAYFPSRNVLPIWDRVLSRAACNASTAGLMAIHIACACYMMQTHRSPLYRLDLDLEKTHIALYDLADALVPSAASLSALELLVAMARYAVIGARSTAVTAGIDAKLADMCKRSEVLDENSAFWHHFTAAERTRARRVAAEIVTHLRWTCLVLAETPFTGPINLARPPDTHDYLHAPVVFPLGSLRESPISFRAFRMVQADEAARAFRYQQLVIETAAHITATRECIERCFADSHLEDPLLVQDIRAALYQLQTFQSITLSMHGFPFPSPDMYQLVDPASSHHANQALILHTSVLFIIGAMLQHWPNINDISDTRREMLDASEANAKRVMDLIPILRALGDQASSPTITSFSAATLYHAAMTFLAPFASGEPLPRWADPVMPTFVDLSSWLVHEQTRGNNTGPRLDLQQQRQFAANVIELEQVLKGIAPTTWLASAVNTLGDQIITYNLREFVS